MAEDHRSRGMLCLRGRGAGGVVLRLGCSGVLGRRGDIHLTLRASSIRSIHT
jgi:hypothetical protein